MTIKIAKPDNLQLLFTKAARDADKHGIIWHGDINSGHGLGLGFEGSYLVDENYITINVLKKPLYVSKTRIEREINNYLFQALNPSPVSS